MASPLQEAREQLAAKTQQARTIINNPNATATEMKTAQELVQKEIPAIKADIELLSSTDGLKSALDGFDSWANDPVGGSANQAQIAGFKAAGYSEFVQDGKKSVLYSEGEGLMTPAQIKTIQDPEYAQAFKSYCRAKGDVNKMSGAAMKTLSGGIDEDGGFLVPAEVLERIIERKPTPTRIAGLTTGLTTSRDAVVMPKTNYSADDVYTTGVRVQWTGERGKPGETQGPKFGSHRFSIYTAMLQLNATNDLLEDTGFALNAWLGSKFHETVQILRDDMAVRGSGVGQPFGVLTGAGTKDRVGFVKSNSATEITADALVDMAYTIPEQYMENCRWVMNRTNTERTIAKLKDSNGRYLFATGREEDTLANARPSEMLGFGLTRSALMPNIGAGNFPILFGDLSSYYSIERIGFSIRILNEVGALENETIMLGRLRMGGDVAEPWKLRLMKVAA